MIAKPISLIAVMALALMHSGCAIVYHRVEIRPVNRLKKIEVKSPVRVHLTDGLTGFYPRGVTVSDRALEGTGFLYDIALKPVANNPVLTPVPLDSIAAIETFKLCVSPGKTAAFLPVSILLSALMVGARAGSGGGRIDKGMTMDEFPLFSRARGVYVQITQEQRSFSGELIAVQPDRIYVLENRKLRFCSYADIILGEFEKGASLHPIKNRHTPNAKTLAHLKLFSRYPQGLSSTLLQKLLAVHGQTSPSPAVD